MKNILKLPIFLNCHFFHSPSMQPNSSLYKIEDSGVAPHPFQLFKLKDEASGTWENLSVYATIDDTIRILMRELVTVEVADEIIHGQATVNPAEIMEKINRGKKSVSLYGSIDNDLFKIELDIDFENLIERK